jgi:hypothetical protein
VRPIAQVAPRANERRVHSLGLPTKTRENARNRRYFFSRDSARRLAYVIRSNDQVELVLPFERER